MCIIRPEVQSVGKTKIYSGSLGGRKRSLVYQMEVTNDQPCAMILPVPTAKDTSIEFVNLEEYEDFFKDMERAFERPKSRGFAKSLGGYGNDCLSIEVQDVGSFIASVVPSVNDFHRLDEQFRLPESVIKSLPYEGFSFAVFQMKSGHHKIHPMAFTYVCSNDKLFFPTVHLHDGDQVQKFDDYDHSLYAGWVNGIGNHWEKATYPIEKGLDLKDALGLVQSDLTFSKLNMIGEDKNGDVIVEGNTSSHDYHFKQKGEFYDEPEQEQSIVSKIVSVIRR